MIAYILLFFCFVLVSADLYPKTPQGYFIGKVPDENNAGISGDIYVVNETTILCDKCNYNYPAPDMFFYVDQSDSLTENGLLLPTEEFGQKPIKHYENAKVLLKLPNNRKIQEFKSFGFWCRQFRVNFGTLAIDKSRLPF